MSNPFDTWAPNNRGPTENTAFSAYSYRQQKIEDLINRLAKEDDPNDNWAQQRIAIDVGINLDRLTNSEIEYIEREVANRRC